MDLSGCGVIFELEFGEAVGEGGEGGGMDVVGCYAVVTVIRPQLACVVIHSWCEDMAELRPEEWKTYKTSTPFNCSLVRAR